MTLCFFFQTSLPALSLLRVSSSSSSRNHPSGSFQPKQHRKPEPLAARDAVITFGRHKGKMLGSLPSSYLIWVSKHLRAGDTEHWAKLADEVLEDPVYRDRIEWEFAERVLKGSIDDLRGISSLKTSNGEASAVSRLLEISERFGWDNDDKDGWRKVRFELLGTSKGGRIPRLKPIEDSVCRNRTGNEFRESNDSGNEKGRVLGKKGNLEDGGATERRRGRRERGRLRREMGAEKGETGAEKGETRASLSQSQNEEDDNEDFSNAKIHNPFPGRENLLRKVMNRARFP